MTAPMGRRCKSRDKLVGRNMGALRKGKVNSSLAPTHSDGKEEAKPAHYPDGWPLSVAQSERVGGNKSTSRCTVLVDKQRLNGAVESCDLALRTEPR